MSPTRGGRWGQRYPVSPPPLPVTGGIAARSGRGAIGTSWWSRRFLQVLESFALGTRLTRGRGYARQGQVISLDVLPGVVTAEVQGSRRTPYRVAIGLAPYPEATWRRIDQALAAQALFTAELLAGRVPQELEELLAGVGVPLFPESVAQLRMHCSCPDHAVPCKHLAAVFYLLAERFDSDPFAILLWRGRDRDALLRWLREHHSGTDQPDQPDRQGQPDQQGPPEQREPAGRPERPVAVVGAALALAPAPSGEDGAEPAGDAGPRRFWESAATVGAPAPAVPAPADLVLRQLGDPPPLLGGAALVEQLRPVYLALAEDDPGTGGDR